MRNTMKKLSVTAAIAALTIAGGGLTAAPASASPPATVTLVGHVRDAQGDPIAGLLVGAGRPGDTARSHWDQAHTSSTGRYELHVAPGAEYMVFNAGVTKREYARLTKDFTATSGRTYRIDRTLPLVAQFAGTIRDAAGNRVSGEVIAYDATTGEKTEFRVPTNRLGQYHLLLPPGSYKLRLSVWQSGNATWFGDVPSRDRSPVLTIAPGQKIASLNATLPEVDRTR